MRLLVNKLKPTNGLAHILHLGLQVALPVIVFVLVRLSFVQLALSIIVLSKWRMFAVRPRFWPANIRANAVDLMVGLSVVLFMTHSGGTVLQLLWAVLYGVWLIAIKPASGMFMTSTQAFIGQLCALMALYLVWAAGPIDGLTLLTGLFCYLAARHFFESFNEPNTKLLAYVWGYFGAALAWLTSHMLLFYPSKSSGNSLVAQPVIFLTALGYGIAVLYYLQHFDRLSKGVRRQTVFVIMLVVSALVVSLYLETRHLVA